MTNKSYLTLFFSLCIIALTVIWCGIKFLPEFYQDREYGMWQAKKTLIQQFKADKEGEQSLIIIGDSRAVAGINPLDSQQTMLNLALGGGTPLEGFYTYQSLLQQNSDFDHKLVLSYAPTHFHHGLWLTRTAKYHYFSDDIINEAVSQSAALNDEVFMDMGHHITLREGADIAQSYAYYVPSLYIKTAVKGAILRRYRQVNEAFENTVHSLGYSPFGTADANNQKNEFSHLPQDYQIAPVADFYMRKLIELAATTGTTVYLSPMPFNPASCEAAKGHPAMNIYQGYLTSLAQEFTHVSVLNEVDCLPENYFGDPSHLNAAGAKYMTATLEKRLSRY